MTAICWLCDRSFPRASRSIPRHLDMGIGVLCPGSEVPVDYSWSVEAT